MLGHASIYAVKEQHNRGVEEIPFYVYVSTDA